MKKPVLCFEILGIKHSTCLAGRGKGRDGAGRALCSSIFCIWTIANKDFIFLFVALIAEGTRLVILCWLIQHCFVPGNSRLANIIFCSLLLVHTQSRRKMSGKRGWQLWLPIDIKDPLVAKPHFKVSWDILCTILGQILEKKKISFNNKWLNEYYEQWMSTWKLLD